MMRLRRIHLLVLTLSGLLAYSWVCAAEQPPRVQEKAKDFELMALGGKSIKLSELTKDQPVVLVVLRGYPGYQCPLCSKQFADFNSKAEDFKKQGAQVVFIYPGPSDDLQKRATEFVKGKTYPDHFSILLDPDYTFTKLYHLRWNAKNETAYPATFVIGKDGKIQFAKVSQTHGGRTTVAEVLKSLNAK